MRLPPNELYSAFSFLGFVLCAIPFYWHFKARNTGTCLFMFWTGLGCLLQCINSIVWNKNMINRAPIYCDISIHVQIALNVAIPASSLCINRLLYRVARMKSAGSTDAENRRVVIIDLLIGVGIPVLQMGSLHIVVDNRYNLWEDFGPYYSVWITLPTFFLISAWPVAIGTVSLFYCAMAIRAFYKRRRNHMQLLSGHNGGQYLRLMAISATDMLGTVPLAIFYIVFNAKIGLTHWTGWASMHSHHSRVDQFAGFIWRNVPEVVTGLEMFRWSLVACAFIFFALFGCTTEAREQYYGLYKLLARRVGMSASASHGAQHIAPTVPYVNRSARSAGGPTDPIMARTGRDRVNSSVSLTPTDQPAVLPISVDSIYNSYPTTVQDSHSDVLSFYTAKSFNEPGMQDGCQSGPPPGILLAVSLSPFPPHFPGAFESTVPVRASSCAETV